MNCSEVAEEFFLALAEERWHDAVSFLSRTFMREHAQHVRHRFKVKIHDLEGSAASVVLPEDLDELFALWLEQADVRTGATRLLAEVRRDQPDHEWSVVGGIEAPRRWVVGEIPESEDRAIVVYRRGRGKGTPSTLELRHEEGRWRICSEEFAMEGHPGLAVGPKTDRRDI